jgi:large conductance mechanosensitive channel
VRLKFSSKTLREFRTFALKPNAIDLAIAVAIGAAFTAVVNAIVQGLFTPIIGVIFHTDFANLSFTINGSVFAYGKVINALITFIVIAFALFFFVVKPMNALRARFHLDIDPDAPPTAPCTSCTTQISTSAIRCPACTELLGAGWAGAQA